MASIKHFSIVPPGGWRYIQPETGVRFDSDTFDGLVRQVTVHRKYKGFPFENVAAEIERQLCWGLTEEQCRPEPGEDYKPVRDLSSEMTVGMAISFGKALVAFFSSGGQTVPKEESARRAAICRGCPFNKPSKSCPCTSVYSAVEAFVPKDRKEPGVSVCMACGCSLQAKVLAPSDVITASLPADIVLPPWCWQRPGDPLKAIHGPDTT